MVDNSVNNSVNDSVNAPPPLCPISDAHALVPFVPCDPAELAPLVAFLERNEPADETRTFSRGTLTADGRLDLCKQSIGVAGCRAVLDALRGNTRVKSLLLGTNGIGDAGAGLVADFLETDASVETVYLGCNRIGAAGARRLAESLSVNRAVTGLWLKRNPVGDAGGSAMAAMLAARPLRTLDLVNTGIGAASLKRLADAILTGDAPVERFYLGANGLRPADAALLARLLRETDTLRGLYLNVNHLGDAGACLLADALAANRGLEELALASNGIGADGFAALLAAASRNETLRCLDLSHARSTRALNAHGNDFTGERCRAALETFLRDAGGRCYVDLRGTALSGVPQNAVRPLSGSVIRSVYR